MYSLMLEHKYSNQKAVEITEVIKTPSIVAQDHNSHDSFIAMAVTSYLGVGISHHYIHVTFILSILKYNHFVAEKRRPVQSLERPVIQMVFAFTLSPSLDTAHLLTHFVTSREIGTQQGICTSFKTHQVKFFTTKHGISMRQVSGSLETIQRVGLDWQTWLRFCTTRNRIL